MVGWGDRWCLGRAVPLAIEGPMAEETRGIKWVAEAVDSTLTGTSGLSIPFIRDFAYGIVCMSQNQATSGIRSTRLMLSRRSFYVEFSVMSNQDKCRTMSLTSLEWLLFIWNPFRTIFTPVGPVAWIPKSPWPVDENTRHK